MLNRQFIINGESFPLSSGIESRAREDPRSCFGIVSGVRDRGRGFDVILQGWGVPLQRVWFLCLDLKRAIFIYSKLQELNDIEA